MTIISRFLGEIDGQDLIEYGLLTGIIAVGAIALFPGIATKVTGYFTALNTALP